jgi:RNA polymerase sigma-70 factor (ECF subfamily)
MGSNFYLSMIVPQAGIIIKLCRAYTNNQQDFEDYYQEVCLQIWRSRDAYKHQCSWSTWVYKITLNVCLTYLKKHKNKVVTFTSDPLPEQLITDSQAQPEQAIKALYKAIQQLSEIDRAIILLYLEQVSNKDIAEIMGVSANNLGVRILRIKQKLHRILNWE